jgi:hypothetical protein
LPPPQHQNNSSPFSNKKKQNIENMYDSFIRNSDDQEQIKKSSISAKKEPEVDDKIEISKND